MGDYEQLYQQGLYLSPNQQDLLLAALSSNTPAHKQPQSNPNHTPLIKPDPSPDRHSPNGISAPPSGGFDSAQLNTFGFGDDESPFLDFIPEADFEFPGSAELIGELPGGTGTEYELGEKRKSMDGSVETEGEETGKKRRESEAKKPGRKPLTSEPTTKRKAQNRAAQRAFRERKEKHLKDLETKVDELQKSSDSANQENGLLRAQVERLQVELREYRKRLSWMTSSNGISAMSAIPSAHSRGAYGLQNNDLLFDFPKFGDLPGSHLFNGQANKNDQPKKDGSNRAPGVLSRDTLNGFQNFHASRAGDASKSNASTPTGPGSAKSNSAGSYGTPGSSTSIKTPYNNLKPSTGSTNDTATSDSPSSSSDSHQSQLLSSSGTSPEPSLNSPPEAKPHDSGNICGIHGSINGEESFCAKLGMACGNINNPIPAARDQNSKPQSVSSDQPVSSSTEDPVGFDWLAQQNGGQFDPVLFGDWREPQDAVLSQDFGSFFNDAFPLPDLGSPSHNLSEAAVQQAPKKDLIAQIDSKLEEEVVPGEDKSQMLSCTKIWDRLQSMEKFRNGEIDVDNLCSELRTKARCSEGGVVVNQRDVDDIMGRAK
ncbi:AP-1-like transcription factor napA [Penicillium macrosclerotiorum]|uniref:AP-1-like transcription factor napA n=1 Tax=Penicillium macrosclerotiorum TaxID=303699 RepID=UPI0025465F1E|nr:AP-1-like transcription factor napA [Penicillium macrosclerotiorum]KAJ5666639.1 AP-1-like transcription factor napA [Penicillium macrosclerotiorum]